MQMPPLRAPHRLHVGAQLLRLLWRPKEVHVVAGVSCSGKSTYIARHLMVDEQTFVVGVRAFPARRGRQIRARQNRTILHWDLSNAPPEELPVDHPAWLLVRAARSIRVTLVAPDPSSLLLRLERRALLRPDLPDFYKRRYAHYTDPERLAGTYVGAISRLRSLPVSQILLTDGNSIDSVATLGDAVARIETLYSQTNVTDISSTLGFPPRERFS